MSDLDRARVEAIAQHLLREGHVDDEGEARLAAIEIILARAKHAGAITDAVADR